MSSFSNKLMDTIQKAPVGSEMRRRTSVPPTQQGSAIEREANAFESPAPEADFNSLQQYWGFNEKMAIEQPFANISEKEPNAELPSFGRLEGNKYERWQHKPPGGQKNWKLVTMRWPYLRIMIFITLVLAALQEFLFQHSSRNGGLLSFESVNDLSVGQYFLRRYAPTLTLVLFGLMVEATDFEMKKLQPYYSMARPQGASAAESVLLEPMSPWTYLTNPRLVGVRIFTSEIMVLIATLTVPTLQNASLGSIQDEKFKQHIVVNNVWSRLLTCSLCLLTDGSLRFELIQPTPKQTEAPRENKYSHPLILN